MYSYWEKTTKDKRMIKGAMNRFVSFINEEYPFFSGGITPNQISKDMLEHFIDYLKDKSTGEGAYSYWKRFKKMVKAATEKGLFVENPCNGIVLKADDEALKKDILSIEEMQQLINTTYPEQNKEIRRAFIFTLYTGIRFCDVKELTYNNIDYSERLLSFNQNKTQGHSKRSWVYIPLNDGLLSLVGVASTDGKLKWGQTKAKLAYFLFMVFCKDDEGKDNGLKFPESALNKLFGEDRLGKARTQLVNNKKQGYEDIDSLFD